MSRSTKKRIDPKLDDNDDDVPIRMTARQIAVEEAKAVKAQADFQAKRRVAAQSKKKQQSKRKRGEDEESPPLPPPPPPKEITVVRKTQLIRGKTKRQASVAAKPKIIVETVVYDSDDSNCFKTSNMIKKFLLDQEKEQAKTAVATNTERDAAEALAGMKSGVEVPAFGDIPDDEMSTSKSSQSAVSEASLSDASTCTVVGEDEEEEDEEEEDEGKNADTDEENQDDDMLDAGANYDEDYPMADPKTVCQLLTKKYKKTALDGAIAAARRVAAMELALAAKRKKKGLPKSEDMDDEELLEGGGFFLGDVRDTEREKHLTDSMKEREMILDDMAALKLHASYHRHPEYPVAVFVDPTEMGRNYFCRPSAPIADPVLEDKDDVSDDGDNAGNAIDDDATEFNPEEEKEDDAEEEMKDDAADPLWDDNHDVEEQEENKGKKGRGNRKRPAGNPPVSALQQNDNNVRSKLDIVSKRMEVVHQMSLPITRQDRATSEDKAENPEEKDWPWVIHGCFCYMEQAPNEDGQKSNPERLATPEIHFWPGSDEAHKHLSQRLLENPTVFVHKDFNAYMTAFRSDSGLAKPAPPGK